MTQLHELTALEQAAAVRAGQVSPVELVSHYLQRIERRDGELGAFLTVTADQALGQAKAAEALISGSDPAGLPPLLGVPVAIKDLTATVGVRTTYGSRAYASHVPGADAHLVTMLREELLRPLTRHWRAHGRKVTGAQYTSALAGLQLAAARPWAGRYPAGW